jgi:hypothetical protein
MKAEELVQARIDAIANKEILTNSQMSEYIKVLAEYAQGCEHITEMGVAIVCSTWAWLSAKPKRLVSVDIDHLCPVDEVRGVAKELGIDFEFVAGDTNHGVTAELNDHCKWLNNAEHRGEWDKGNAIPYYNCEPTDLLFIDTYHHYASLKREFELHASKAKKYIILHDTVTFGRRGEGDDHKGLMAAVEEFLAVNPQWVTEKELTSAPGLYIMKRVGPDTV